MVTHVTIKAVADVGTFLNQHGLELEKVRIAYSTGKFGGNYVIFYNTEDFKETSK